MQNMKKILAALLALIMVLALVACGSETDLDGKCFFRCCGI